jgi:hypothetical protein
MASMISANGSHERGNEFSGEQRGLAICRPLLQYSRGPVIFWGAQRGTTPYPHVLQPYLSNQKCLQS